MGVIWTPWEMDRQPLEAERIDRSNPLTKRVTTLVPFSRTGMQDLVTGNHVQVAAGTLGVDQRGISLRGSGSAACASIPLNLSAYTKIVLSFWMYWDAFANDDDLAMEFTANGATTTGGFGLDPNQSSTSRFQIFGHTGFPNTGAASFTRPSAAAWHHYMVGLDTSVPGFVSSVYVDGVSQSLTTDVTGNTTVSLANSTLYLFSRNNTSLFGAGRIQNLVIRGGVGLLESELRAEYQNPWQLFEAENDPVFYSLGGGATDYPVTATDALTLADSASQSFAATGVAADAMTLADSASNVAALGATASDALTLADSASNVAALSATATDALTLADTLNATASGDYAAIGSDALTLADSASNVAALGATGSDALTLADAASNVAALGAAASDALTLADTLNASASGDYVVVATDALSLSDSVVAAYAAICIATDALSLADATSAAMAGQYAATATDALTLADAASNAAALGVSISEALTLAALVSALNSGQLVLGVRGRPGVQIQTGTRRAQIQTGTRRN